MGYATVSQLYITTILQYRYIEGGNYSSNLDSYSHNIIMVYLWYRHCIFNHNALYRIMVFFSFVARIVWFQGHLHYSTCIAIALVLVSTSLSFTIIMKHGSDGV